MPQELDCKKPWVCSSGCKVTEVPCQHLEAMLPFFKEERFDSGWHKPTENRAGTCKGPEEALEEKLSEDREERLLRCLIGVGLGEAEIDLVMSLYYDNYTFRELRDRDGYTSVWALQLFDKHTIEKLKAQGFVEILNQAIAKDGGRLVPKNRKFRGFKYE
jgi:hypothetical protein